MVDKKNLESYIKKKQEKIELRPQKLNIALYIQNKYLQIFS